MKRAFLYAGIALLVTAVFAQQFGIDNDEGWGKGRIIMLSSGVGLILISSLLRILQDKLIDFKKHILGYINLKYSTQVTLASLVATIIVITMYIWFSQPIARDFENNYNYCSELALGFKSGHLYLRDEPSSALLSLDNPYDYYLRKQYGVEDFPWDVSLYNRKFYIYWGPAPSLILTIFSKDQLARIGDQYMALLFACGLFIYSSLMVISCWYKSAERPFSWLLGITLLTIGLTAPVTIMLKEARIYEAAIFGSQFFFIGGCYWIYSSFSSKKLSLPKFAIAGMHWAFALATRITILPIILFSTAVTILYILKAVGVIAPKLYLPLLTALGIPLILAASSLGWYNWARFGSIFEFGLTHQLTNVNYNIFKDSFSTHYVTGNLYNYFVHPLKLTSKFPYIMRIEYPASNDRMAGLLYLSPYIFLIFAPLLRIFSGFQKTNNDPSIQETKRSSKNWLSIIFIGSAFIGMAIILSFYFVTMRYIEDFMPSLMLLVTIQLGQELQLSNQNNTLRRILTLVTTTLAMLTITVNILVAMPNSGIAYVTDLLNAVCKLLGLK